MVMSQSAACAAEKEASTPIMEADISNFFMCFPSLLNTGLLLVRREHHWFCGAASCDALAFPSLLRLYFMMEP